MLKTTPSGVFRIKFVPWVCFFSFWPRYIASERKKIYCIKFNDIINSSPTDYIEAPFTPAL